MEITVILLNHILSNLSSEFLHYEQLRAFVSQLIWHFHEGRTISTINFNYDVYANLL
jgi:hypothetical protein